MAAEAAGAVREWIDRYAPEPEDGAARKAPQDSDYYKGLVAYGMDIAEFTQGIWEKEYLGQS